MKRLDIEIKTNGHTYILHRRSEKVALYKQYFEGMHVGWEYGLIKLRKAEKIKGVQYEERETFFANSEFGVTAFSPAMCLTEEQVIQKFENYVKEVESKI